MNIVNKLTIRHLKENKRRTLVTILGTIISAAMISAVATLGVSYADLLKKDHIEANGDWHVVYKDLSFEQTEGIRNDSETEILSLIQESGFAKLEDPPTKNKPYLFIQKMNEEAYEQFSVEISEGRLPQSEDELIISESAEDVHLEIGDTLTLEVGTRYSDSTWAVEQGEFLTNDNQVDMDEEGNQIETLIDTEEMTYTIVGSFERPGWERGWSPSYMALSSLDLTKPLMSETMDAYVSLNSLNRSLYDHASGLAEELDISSVSFNGGLLQLSGITASDTMDRTRLGLLVVIISIIIIGSVALIFNAFAISVSERSRHLGMLSSVGATKKQKRNSVFFEGFIVGIISIPIGILSGIAGIAVTFAVINPIIDSIGLDESLKVVVTPFSMVAAVLISAATIFISTWLPAHRASRITAMDAIRQTHDIKLKNKTVRTSNYVRKWLGLEAELGLKNLKRNKKRYHITVLSLIVSIVLFLSVSYFTQSLKQSYQLAEDTVNYDVQVYTTEEEILPELLERIGELTDVTDYQLRKETNLTMYVDEDEIAPEINKSHIMQDEDGRYIYSVNLTALDEKSLHDYAKQAGFDGNLNDTELAAIVVDDISYEDYELGKYIETKAIRTEVGRTLPLFEENWETNKRKDLPPLTVSVLTGEVPMGPKNQGPGSLEVIVSESTFESILSETEEAFVNQSVYMTSDNPTVTQMELEQLEFFNQFAIDNLHDIRESDAQMITVISVFIYGFITLITLISLANILNTISTGVALRKREFAMLRSVGMTQASFKKMMMYESAFYGIKSLFYGIPISIAIMYLIYYQTQYGFTYTFQVPWLHVLGVIVAIFGIVSLAMLYSLAKTKQETIIEGLTQENQ